MRHSQSFLNCISRLALGGCLFVETDKLIKVVLQNGMTVCTIGNDSLEYLKEKYVMQETVEENCTVWTLTF